MDRRTTFRFATFVYKTFNGAKPADRRLGGQILKGAKAGELPIEHPAKFEFVINLKAANSLGLTIPQSLPLRANQVIE